MTTTLRTLFVLLLLVVAQSALWATQWTVDNSPNSPGQFINLQAAIDSASAGDTLLVSASVTSYGNVVVNKPLVIWGSGYAPANPTSSADFHVTSSDVHISGFLCGSMQVGNDWAGQDGSAYSLSNVTIERCHSTSLVLWGGHNPSPFQGVGSPIPTTVHNVVIKECVLLGGVLIGSSHTGYAVSFNAFIFDGLTFMNNLFSACRFTREPYGPYSISGTETFILDHNTVINGSGLFLDQFGQPNWPQESMIVRNSIFRDAHANGCPNCTLYNNMTFGNGANDTVPGVPPGNNNYWGVDPLLVTYPGGAFDFAHNYTLLAGSPAINAASDGTDIGMTGGQFPFQIGLPPALPFVDYVNISRSAVPEGGTLFLQFDARVRP